MKLGDSATLTRTIAEADIDAYARLTGHESPAGTVPGPLLGALISQLLGTHLPGRGTNWMKQTYQFPHPCPAGRPITATVTITRLRPEKDLVNLGTTCTCEGREVLTGEALVMAREMA